MFHQFYKRVKSSLRHFVQKLELLSTRKHSCQPRIENYSNTQINVFLKPKKRVIFQFIRYTCSLDTRLVYILGKQGDIDIRKNTFTTNKIKNCEYL